MAGKYNTWLRAKLADRIRNNGGYNQGYRDKFALVWTVRYYDTGVNDAEEAAEALIEHEYFINGADLNLQFPNFDRWFAADKMLSQGQMYEYARDRLQDDLSDDEGLKMWSPETATRYGFDYKGEGADKPFRMVLEGVSSGGKRVALSMFDYEKLEVDNNDLADAVDPATEKDDYALRYSNSWCRKLMGIMDELDKALTEENANRCGRYYATDYIARELGLFD
jgi:hypothetical protein